MTDETPHAGPWRLGLLLLGNAALAMGPLLVRLADTGPVAAGFWRLTLALPVILLLGWRERGKGSFGRTGVWFVIAAGVFFALDIAAWHIGIERTRLGNAALFGNSGSVILVVWSLLAARRVPYRAELGAIAAAVVGSALLMGGSLEIGRENLIGDLFSLLAGMLYATYILMLRHLRGRVGSWTLLSVSVTAGVPVLFAIAYALGEQIVPTDWTPLIVLSVLSQIVGQGVLIWALFWFRPLVIGLALLTQPAIAAFTGWIAFGETLSPGDVVGMVLMATALVLARIAGPRAGPARP
ncbi:DMT family transporter [Croceicoccus pelagius]|uniref:Membrane protein n=1 Tax=Croceicoccus pelagius TaxID=1703341 RepID=A0A916YD62_9SPHN|nr:DMT family transporter [Croceicoccus pelagius]GGD39979.1 membrane protein [Croceicoccus pelagius]